MFWFGPAAKFSHYFHQFEYFQIRHSYWREDKACQTDPEKYFKVKKSCKEARLHYIVQYYQFKMKNSSLNETQGKRYIKILDEWRKEFCKNHRTTYLLDSLADQS
jgi:hypothetical protein